MIEVPYYDKNETSSKHFLKKFHKLTNELYEIKIKWITKKMRNLFRLKRKNPHPACSIYEGVCICKENYVGETKQNVEIRCEVHLLYRNFKKYEHCKKMKPTSNQPAKLVDLQEII